MKMDVGDELADRYRIVRLASWGGMGQVFQGRDLETDSTVAIKVLQSARKRTIERFSREISVLAALDNPGIVKYLDHGVIADDEPYLVMEWIDGQDLREVLRRGPISIADTLILGVRIAETMAVVHREGVIHRDIKPANILLPDGKVEKAKVVDFGLVRPTSTPTQLTVAGETLGTPGFMAPEQARGDTRLDYRADIYSTGAVLFTCLAHRAPYAGAHPTAILAKVLLDDVPRPRQFRPAIPASLDQLVYQLIAKDPADRPGDWDEIAGRLRRIRDELDDHDLPAAAGDGIAAVTSGEQRFVTVLVVQLNSAGADALCNAALARCRDLYGARLEELANGTIAGTFAQEGNPEHAAVRAAECALALRAGIDAGSLALATGRGVVDAPLPMGEVIDRAVSLLVDDYETIMTGIHPAGILAEESACTPSPGEHHIVIDDVTAGLLDRRFKLERSGRGHYHLLENANRAVSDSPRLLGLPTQCVGRKRELEMMESMLEQCLEEKIISTTLVLGPPGGGKTRLCYEFLRRVETLPEPVEVWTGSGDFLRSRASCSLLAQLIRNAIGVADQQSPEQRQERIAARVAQVVPGRDSVRVAEFLGELIGAPFAGDGSVQLKAARQDPQLMHQHMHRAFCNWLTAELERSAVLIVLEDLHWADRSTIRFLETAMRDLREQALMVLATARPSVEDAFPNLFGELAIEKIRLRPLHKRACRDLVAQVLDVPDDEVERLVERSEGNPFFLEELCRSVASGSGDVPDTVLAMAESRLANLPPMERQILRAASILGRTFWNGAVAALMGNSLDTAVHEELLEALVGGEFITRQKTARFSDETEYLFRHELTREAAYATLTKEDRTGGHLQAGIWLEEVGETESAVLAKHFELGRAPDRAITWYRRAAEQALETNDSESLFVNVERAIGCGATAEVQGELNLLRAEIHNWRNEPDEARKYGLAAMRLLTEGSAAWADAIHHLAWTAHLTAETDEIAGWVDALVAHAGESPEERYTIAMAHCATQLALGGMYEQAHAIANVIDSRGGEAESSLVVDATVTHMRSILAFLEDEFDRACDLMLAAAESWRKLGNERSYLMDLGNAGSAQLELGEYAEAAETLGAAVAMAERAGLDHLVATNKASRAWALANSNQTREAIALCHEAIAIHPTPRHQIVARTYLAQILIDDDAAQALTHANEALRLTEHASNLKAFVLGVQAQALLSVGRAQGALHSARQGMEILRELETLECGEGVLRLVYAEALQATGHREQANAAILEAEKRLLARASCIVNPQRRARFLQSVPENARTRALARTWSQPAV